MSFEPISQFRPAPSSRLVAQQQGEQSHEMTLAGAETAVEIGSFAGSPLNGITDHPNRLVKGLGQALGHHVVPESGLGIADTVGQLQDEVTLADLSGKIEKLTEEGGRAGSAGWRSGVQIKVQLLGDKSDERRDVSVQSPQLGLLRDLPVCGDLIDLGNHSDGIQVEETDQEIRGVLRFYTPGLQMFGGKVSEVESGDHTTVGPDRRSQDMAIFRIILNLLNERLIALHQCLWKVAPERLVSALDQFGGPTKVLDQSALGF